MATALSETIRQAKQLSANERLKLAAQLLETNGKVQDKISDEEVEGLRQGDLLPLCPVPIVQEKPIVKATTQTVPMRSPYLEHFSQAFARFFMRVGLPSAISPFK